jgi:ribosomal protein S10
VIYRRNRENSSQKWNVKVGSKALVAVTRPNVACSCMNGFIMGGERLPHQRKRTVMMVRNKDDSRGTEAKFKMRSRSRDFHVVVFHALMLQRIMQSTVLLYMIIEVLIYRMVTSLMYSNDGQSTLKSRRRLE